MPVRVDAVETPVRVLCGKPRIETVNWPVVYPSEWARYLLSHEGGRFLLGGHDISNEHGFRGMLATFWRRFQNVRQLELFEKNEYDLSLCIPVGYHGDEGRGKLRRPLMCLSVQPIICFKGEDYTNSSGNLGQSYMRVLLLGTVYGFYRLLL